MRLSIVRNPLNNYEIDRARASVKEYSDKYHIGTSRSRTEMYFSDMHGDTVEHKRKYVNDWSELREFAGLDDIELENNELTILNTLAYGIQQFQKMRNRFTDYNILRIMAGMGGLAYSN